MILNKNIALNANFDDYLSLFSHKLGLVYLFKVKSFKKDIQRIMDDQIINIFQYNS
jgi:hypothetical protein